MQEPLLGRPQLLGVLVGKAPQQISGAMPGFQEGLRRLQETEMREPFIKQCGVYIDSFSTEYLFQRRFVLVCPHARPVWGVQPDYRDEGLHPSLTSEN